MPIIVERREPDYTAYTYEEISQRVRFTLPNTRAPEQPRQPDLAPVKPSQHQSTLFFQPVSQDGAVRPYVIGGRSGQMLGWHTVIAPDGGSYTSSPRGIMRAFGRRFATARRDPSSYADEIPEV